jgi:ankyrin repeat protein
VSDYGRNPHEVGPAADPADEFLRLACLVYGADDLARPARAAELLRADRSLAGHSIHTAAAVGDADAAARMLAADRSLASARGGPFDWEPLLYAAYSRVVSDDQADSQVEVARLLLEHGADPNAGYLWDGTYLFTALTGAFGSGEDAPNQPPHHESIALARLLLEAGADPNDEQTIYNRHFRPDNEHLVLLLAHGLGEERRGPWPARLGGMTEPRLVLEDALVFVADDDAYAERVALLLDHGVDPEGRGTRHPALLGRRPAERARDGGAQRNLELLLAAGAEPPETDAVDELLGLCLRGAGEEVARRLAPDPGLAERLVRRHERALIDAAGRGNLAGVELLARVGFDVDARNRATALHAAAYAGHRDVCELLVALGADPTLREPDFDAQPAAWARHAHHDELADWLEERAAR